MTKVLWLDLETTGLNPIINGIAQVACLVEVGGEIVDSLYIPYIRPMKYDKIEPQALQVNGITMNQLETGEEPRAAYSTIVKLFDKYIDKFDKMDKFVLAGYFAKIDSDFMRQFFFKNGNKFFGSYFHGALLEVSTLLAVALCEEFLPVMPNNKLDTLCKELNVEIQAHEALSDIKATRECYNKLARMMGMRGEAAQGL